MKRRAGGIGLVALSAIFVVAGARGAWSQDERDSANPLAGSALAAERPLVSEYAGAVEGVLRGLDARAPARGEFHLRIDWEVAEGTRLDWSRDGMGLSSFKTSLNWVEPPQGTDFWQTGTLRAAGLDTAFRVARLDDSGAEAELWQKSGEYLYSSRMSTLLPFVTRWRAAEALESGMLAYGEGLALVLAAFQPGEVLRHAQHLAVGDPAQANGRTYDTLVATPDWIANPATLPPRAYYPYNESTLISWAELTPVVTYYVDARTLRIEGAAFSFYRAARSHAGTWTVIPTPKEERLEAWVTEWALSGSGAAMPTRIEGRYTAAGKTVRRTLLTVREETAETAPFSAFAIDRTRRLYESWPPFQSAVYRARIEKGQADYANRVAFVNALAFEGNLTDTIAELKTLLRDMGADAGIAAESMGGIDWHLGMAVYEILQHPGTAEERALWTDFEAKEPYTSILARGLDFYARWRSADNAAVADEYFQRYEQAYGLAARLMYALERQLVERVETETNRGMELQALMSQARDDALRLKAVWAAVEAYLRDGNYEAALVAIDAGKRTLTESASHEKLDEWTTAWDARIAEGLETIDARRKAATIRAKQDLLSQTRSRLARAEPWGTALETARLRAVEAQTAAALQELTK